MLSRVADALYWMGRYVERAESAARLLEVTRRLQIDIGEVDPEAATAQWNRTARLLSLDATTPLEAAVFDASLVGSVASDILRARENARQVQEVVSSEMWDYLNQAYWGVEEAKGRRAKRELLSSALSDIIRASFLWSGAIEATIDRGPSWLFIRLGQFVERLEITSRICVEYWGSLQNGEPTPGDNVGWVTWLRCCGSLEAFRKRYPTRIDPEQVLDFLVLDATYPRSIRYCANVSKRFSDELTSHAPSRGSQAQRAFGKLAARVEFAGVDEVLLVTPKEFLSGVLKQLHEASIETQRAYFLH